MAWTRFYDMHSGGSPKSQFDYIFVEAAEDDARDLVSEALSVDAWGIACDCCGANFSAMEDPTLTEVLEGDDIGGRTVDEFLADPWILERGRRRSVLILAPGRVVASR